MAEPRTIVVGEKGRIVIPAALRRAADMKAGSRMTVWVEEDGRLTLDLTERVLDKAAGMFAHLGPLSDDED